MKRNIKTKRRYLEIKNILSKGDNLQLYVHVRKFYIRRNNNKADSIETGRIVIAHLLP